MSAASPRLQPLVRDIPRASNEPSMEEILASIRRIIADDQAGIEQSYNQPQRSAPSRASVRPHSVEGYVSLPQDLDDSYDLDSEVEDCFHDSVVRPSEFAAEPENEAAQHADAADEQPQFEAETAEADTSNANADFDPEAAVNVTAEADIDESLLSSAVADRVAESFDSLSTVVLNQTPRTMEDLVRDMLRPMLKSWLDENLPPLVERLVRVEIDQIRRKGQR